MTMSNPPISLLMAMAACIGYGIIINIPRKSLLVSSLIGGISWMCFTICIEYGMGKVMAALLASILVALISDICASIFKEAVTIFVIPGIIPFVPGAGMYYTMLSLIRSDYTKAASMASETFFIAGAIALGLLLVGFISRIFKSLYPRND